MGHQKVTDQTHSDVKEPQHDNGVQKADEPPIEGDPVDDAERKKHAQRQAEGDKGLDILRNRNRYFVTLTLVMYRSFLQKATVEILGITIKNCTNSVLKSRDFFVA